MSLYNSVSSSLGLSDSLLGSGGVRGAINSAFGDLGGGISDALGGGQFGDLVGGVVGTAGKSALNGAVSGYISPSLYSNIDKGLGIAGDLASGNFGDAAVGLFRSGFLSELMPDSINGLIAQQLYWQTPTRMFGGVSPSEALEMFQAAQAIQRAQKNLFIIELSSGLGDISDVFNILAIECDYAPQTISGEKRKVGGASVDCVNASEPVELKITTYDNQRGDLKAWFKNHAYAAVSLDGTVGLPAEFGITIKIVHSTIKTDFYNGGYEDIGYFRTANIDYGHSRRDKELQELNMSFTQLDTFMSL